MTEKLNKGLLVLCISFAVIIYVLLLTASALHENVKKIKKDAVRIGYAEYDRTTGEWEWVKK